MLTQVEIKNYRSIVDATVPLSPFTLLIGANGTGKSNFLQFFQDISGLFQANFSQPRSHILGKIENGFERLVNVKSFERDQNLKQVFFSITAHENLKQDPKEYTLRTFQKDYIQFFDKSPYINVNNLDNIPPQLFTEYSHLMNNVSIFSLDPSCIGSKEEITESPHISKEGKGAVQILDSLKTGDREDLFNKIENLFKQYIPEIEKLSFVSKQAAKQLQVRENNIQNPILLKDLSEGTRLVLTILTILFQENPPFLIGLEDIDRGMHPRLFEKIIQLCFDITGKEGGPQIIATTHNPYLVDQFKGREEAVVIVEKEEGATTFTTLAERMKNLDPEEEEPLGNLWYSGFVGGVPKRGK